jgi:hypothetical protein
MFNSCYKGNDENNEPNKFNEENEENQLNEKTEKTQLNGELEFSETAVEELLEGIYIDRNNEHDGLKIERVQDGNYIFTRIFILANEMSESETQSAYVIPEGNKYFYYWHTGRYDDLPGSDAIIVYNMIHENNNLAGTYYFPTSPNQPLGEVAYIYNEDYEN